VPSHFFDVLTFTHQTVPYCKTEYAHANLNIIPHFTPHFLKKAFQRCPAGTIHIIKYDLLDIAIGRKADIVECNGLYPETDNLIGHLNQVLLHIRIVWIGPRKSFFIFPHSSAIIYYSAVITVSQIIVAKTHDPRHQFHSMVRRLLNKIVNINISLYCSNFFRGLIIRRICEKPVVALKINNNTIEIPRISFGKYSLKIILAVCLIRVYVNTAYSTIRM
jgi:hypothetical protein